MKVWFLVGLLPTLLPAQMEKRALEEYAEKQFAAAEPRVGSPIPELALCDVRGRPHCLRELLGKIVVLVTGSFT